MTMKPKYKLRAARPLHETGIKNLSRYRVRSLPAAGALLREEDRGRNNFRCWRNSRYASHEDS